VKPDGLIVVVDDNVELAENLVEILEATGRRAVVADSAEAACEIVRSRYCSAVLTDFRLPGLSGTDLISELRQLGCTIPVAVMTAYADAALIDEAEHVGAVDVLSKPLDIARVLSLLTAMDAPADSVLVVDDNRAFAENVAEVLRGAGWSSVVETSMARALSHRERIKAALVDVVLPDGNGLDLAARLKARYPSAEILMVSAFCLDEVRPALVSRLPGVECLSKPVDVPSLMGWFRQRISGGMGPEPG
jgi:CheY-like chemotaxis protein